MRLQSHIFVSAFLRAEAADGGYPAVIRRGAAEAGAIFVRHDHPDGTISIHAPAPQASYGGEGAPVRAFELVHDHADAATALEWLERQVRFDADCWIIGTERREGSPKLVV